MRITTRVERHAHYLAVCGECDFECCLHSDTDSRADVRAKTRQHVRKTGHTVSIDKSEIVYYSKED